MASDADWVEDVRRWYFAGREASSSKARAVASFDESPAHGYEAAHPSLQARHWPDAPDPDPTGSVHQASM